MRLARAWAGIVAAGLLAGGAGAETSTRTETLSIGTGTVSGVYLPAGGAICTMVNRARKTTGVHCVVAPTEGSVANLEALRDRQVDFAIAQSDVVADAAAGRDRFATVGADGSLRSVFALHAETLSIVVSEASDIDDFDGLKGRRVAVGPPGSGQRVLLDLLLQARGWTLADFASVLEVAPTEEAEALCDGKVDAAIYMAGNPTGAMGVPDYLGWDWKSKAGLPVVCVPGCPIQPDNLSETLTYLLYQVTGQAPMIPLDENLRPKWLFGQTVHEGCDRAGYYEQGDFATEYGSPKCIVKLGCWGPVVKCNVPKRGWMAGIGGCPNVGGICIGCTMPGFPDKFMPFMDEPPGGILSSSVSEVYGSVIRTLRHVTGRTLDKEPRWREPGHLLRTGAVRTW